MSIINKEEKSSKEETKTTEDILSSEIAPQKESING